MREGEECGDYVAIAIFAVISNVINPFSFATRFARRRARAAKPCVLFFDEIDGVVGDKGMMGRQGVEARVMSTFLNEMDGLDTKKDDGVLVLAATNRPNVLDEALLRAGRFERRVYVGPPDGEGR